MQHISKTCRAALRWRLSAHLACAALGMVVLVACGGGGSGGGGSSVAPVITSQPANPTVSIGAKATFTIVAEGTSPLTYQWKKDGAAIANAINASYTTGALGMGDQVAVYTVEVTNSAGSVTSQGVFVTLESGKYQTVGTNLATSCIKDKVSGLIWEGKLPGSGERGNLRTYTNYDSSAPGNKQKTMGANLVDARVEDLALQSNSLGYVKVVNDSKLCGFGNWRIPTQAELLDIAAADAEWFPNTQNTGVNSDRHWSATPDSVSYYAQTVNLITKDHAMGMRTDQYAVRLVRSIPEAPTIITPPDNQTVVAGARATFTVVAEGAAPLTYQWKKNGSDIVNAKNVNYTTEPLEQADDGAAYTVEVKNAWSTVTSRAATVKVMPASDVYGLVGSYPITSCVKDKKTGLIWEGKEAADNGKRAFNLIYTHFDVNMLGKPLKKDRINVTQADIDADANWVGYARQVNGMVLCGYNDWRLPTFRELLSLVKEGTAPTIDTTWFPYTNAAEYWAADWDGDLSQGAGFVVRFETGKAMTPVAPYSLNSVRLVRP